MYVLDIFLIVFTSVFILLAIDILLHHLNSKRSILNIMRKTTDSESLYLGFRDFVEEKRLNEYDNEYFNKKKPGFKFMIPFIYKYVDVDSLKNKVKEPNQISLVTYFINDYCSRSLEVLKELKKIKKML